METYNFKDGELVDYKVTQGLQGKGKVIGAATSEQPVMGRIYIIEDLSGNVPSDVFPFKVFTVPECLLRKIDG